MKFHNDLYAFSSVIFIFLEQFYFSPVRLPFLAHDSIHFVVLILSISGKLNKKFLKGCQK
jgi:hypothetical protein